MKYLILFLTITLSLHAHAQDSTQSPMRHDSTRTHDSKPWDYIMMKHGQMIEVTKGVQTPLIHDAILVNESTIHPDGTINDSNGKTKHLKEGKYITMDGRIRSLKKLPKGLPAQ